MPPASPAADQFIHVCPCCALVYRAAAIADCPLCDPSIVPGLEPLAGARRVAPVIVAIGNPAAGEISWRFARRFKDPNQ